MTRKYIQYSATDIPDAGLRFTANMILKYRLRISWTLEAQPTILKALMPGVLRMARGV